MLEKLNDNHLESCHRHKQETFSASLFKSVLATKLIEMRRPSMCYFNLQLNIAIWTGD